MYACVCIKHPGSNFKSVFGIAAAVVVVV